MKKIYIVYFDWPSTSGNHAGMSYYAKSIKIFAEKNIILIKNIPFKGRKILCIFHTLLISFYLTIRLRKDDKIIFTEYLGKDCGYQDIIAFIISVLRNSICRYGIIHLNGNHLREIFKNDIEIIQKTNYLNKIIVFGSSLNIFLKNIGVQKEIITTYYYVDNIFYKPNIQSYYSNKNLKVIVMGSLKRNFNLLQTS